MDLSIACERMPKRGETMNGYNFFMNPGGKGGNQAVACANCDALTYMIACVGHDTFGSQLKEALRTRNVNIHYVQETIQHTGIAVIIRHDSDNRILLENGANHMISTEHLQNALSRMAETNDVFLTQLENNFSAVAFGLHEAKQRGMYTVFNPAPALALPKAIFQDVDLFVVNQSECELLCGIYPSNKDTIHLAIEKFKELSCDVIITLGKQGSIAYIQKKYYELQAYAVEAMDTTGAGDTFVGVYCAMIAQSASVEEALRYANAASALTVMKEGAQSAIPARKEIEAFIKEQDVSGVL